MNYFLLILFLLSNLNLKAQTTVEQKNRQEFGLAMYNVGFGGVTAGLGAMINKKKGTKNGKAFLQGFKYGCLGGAINYGAKRLDCQIYQPHNYYQIKSNQKFLLWGWPVKIIHSIGTSIIYNAAKNIENPFKNYDLGFGFMNLNINFEKKIKIQPKLMPFGFSTLLYYSFSNKYFHFSAKESLLSGSPIFLYSSNFSGFSQNYDGKNYNGIIALNSILNNPSFSSYRIVLAHETIHTLQEEENQVYNNYFIKSYNKILSHRLKLKMILDKYISCDFPFDFILYYMYSPVIHTTPVPDNIYYKNLFELEAQHFATNSYIPHG